MPRDNEFESECVALGQACATAKMRLDEKGPGAYKRAFQSYRGPKEVPDYFGRKWLSLRLSAAKRGMVVDKFITPSFLRSITPLSCPVTGDKLDTVGKSPRNPSVDRLVNEVSYRAGNICVLSVRANRAKGELSFEDVLNCVQGGIPSHGLSQLEWLRLLSLMYGAWSRAYKNEDPYLIPLAAMPAPGMFTSTSQVVQMLLARNFGAGAPREQASSVWLERTQQAGAEPALFLEMRDVLSDALAVDPDPCAAWVRTDVFQAFTRWYQACEAVVAPVVEESLQRMQDARADPVAARELMETTRYHQ